MQNDQLLSFELFAGAGGLAIGTEMAGFCSQGTIEWDKWACRTMRKNIQEDFPLVRNWNVHEMDVREFHWSSVKKEIDLLAGGPPCQPFSIGGIAKAHEDSRDMFPAMIAAVRNIKPRAFLVENVKGLLRAQFSDYYQYILLRLEFPERVIRPNETWVEHLHRLQQAKTSSPQSRNELTYNVIPTLVNAADYGVPQKRERVLIVGFRSDLGIEWSFPEPTHSLESLKWIKRDGGEYWEKHKIPKGKQTGSTDNPNKPLGGKLPWRTVRDALAGLPDPTESDTAGFYNHILKTGARIYPGHTGSVLDMPSKTLKAGVHGVPGGENMFIQDNGKPRYYTIREAARIQTFPDGYKLDGAWSEAMRQLGNAVPVLLAQKVVSSIAEAIILNEIDYRIKRKVIRLSS